MSLLSAVIDTHITVAFLLIRRYFSLVDFCSSLVTVARSQMAGCEWRILFENITFKEWKERGENAERGRKQLGKSVEITWKERGKNVERAWKERRKSVERAWKERGKSVKRETIFWVWK